MNDDDRQELANKFLIPILNVLTHHAQMLLQIEASIYTLRRAAAGAYPVPVAALAKIEDADEQARKIALETNKLPELDAIAKLVNAGKNPNKPDA